MYLFLFNIGGNFGTIVCQYLYYEEFSNYVFYESSLWITLSLHAVANILAS